MINITLKDGVAKEYQAPITPIEIAKDLSAGLAKAACAAKVNGELRDLRFPIESDANVSILTFEDAEGKRHSGTPAPMCWPRRCSTCIPRLN